MLLLCWGQGSLAVGGAAFVYALSAKAIDTYLWLALNIMHFIFCRALLSDLRLPR